MTTDEKYHYECDRQAGIWVFECAFHFSFNSIVFFEDLVHCVLVKAVVDRFSSIVLQAHYCDKKEDLTAKHFFRQYEQ